VFLYDRVLALFAASPYEEPASNQADDGQFLPLDLKPHLTNTSFQDNPGQDVVRLLDELVGCRVVSRVTSSPTEFTTEDVTNIMDQMAFILGETFKAALENPVHFQVKIIDTSLRSRLLTATSLCQMHLNSMASIF